MISKLACWSKEKFHAVMHLQDDKKSIAAGVAIGVFWGFTPLFGFKTILTFLTAWAMRVNKVAAVATIALHELLLPLYPFYLDASYRLGSWILQDRKALHSEHILHILHHPSLWRGEAANLWPLLLGSVILAIIPTGLAYILTLGEIERRIERAAKLKAECDPSV